MALQKKVRRAPKGKVNRTPNGEPEIELELFVSGITPKSIRAIEVLKELCATQLAERCSLKVIDIYREPKLAKENNVIAVPALIMRRPSPRKMFIGDFSDVAPILSAVGVRKDACDEQKTKEGFSEKRVSGGGRAKT